MKRFTIISSAVLVTGFIASCGGGGSSSPGGVTTKVSAPAISTTATPITTSAQAAKSVNASKTLATSLVGGGVAFPTLGSLVGKSPAEQSPDGHKLIRTIRNIQKKSFDIVDRQKSMAKTVAATQTFDCADGGKMTFTDGSTVSVSFSGCKNNGSYMNGTMSMPMGMYDGTNYAGTIAANFTTIDYDYYSTPYTVKIYESTVNMTMSVTEYSEAGIGNMAMSMNGYSRNIDYSSSTSDQEVFSNFNLSMTNTNDTGSTTTMLMSGSMSMDTFKDISFKTIDTGSGMSFQNFNITEIDSGATSAVNMSGKFAIQTTEDCINGTFDISTQTDVVVNNSTGMTSAGQMTINGVVTTFNSDGTVTATVNGTPYTDLSYSNACTLSF